MENIWNMRQQIFPQMNDYVKTFIILYLDVTYLWIFELAIKTSIFVIRGFCNLMATKVIYLIPSNSTRKFDCRKCLTLNMFDIFKPKINICLDQKYIYCPIAFLYQKGSKISTFVWLCQWMPAKSKITEQ